MGSSFLKVAQKSVKDVQEFLKESAGGNSLKYSPEPGKKHHIYFPAIIEEVTDENGSVVQTKKLNNLVLNVHEWNTSDNKYKACVCLKDIIRHDDNGNLLNDGSCPFCERESDAWDIYNLRKADAEAKCMIPQSQAKAREEYLKNVLTSYRNDMKAKKAKPYMYVVVALFKTDNNDQIIMDEKTQLPAYEIKVMKLSSARVEKINKIVVNAGLSMHETEIIIDYPATDDKMRASLDATFQIPFPGTSVKDKFPAVVDKITADAIAFDWDGIEKTFSEMAGMTTFEAKSITDSLFEQWDKYQLEVKTNPNARYLEYVVEQSSTQPDINGVGAPQLGVDPGAPVVPNVGAPVVPNVGAPVVPNVGAPVMTDVTPSNSVIPNTTQPNINNVFAQSPTLSI